MGQGHLAAGLRPQTLRAQGGPAKSQGLWDAAGEAPAPQGRVPGWKCRVWVKALPLLGPQRPPSPAAPKVDLSSKAGCGRGRLHQSTGRACGRQPRDPRAGPPGWPVASCFLSALLPRYIYIIYNRRLSPLSVPLSISLFQEASSVISLLSANGVGKKGPISLAPASWETREGVWGGVEAGGPSVDLTRPCPGVHGGEDGGFGHHQDQAATGSPQPWALLRPSCWASEEAPGPGHSGFGEAPRARGSFPPLWSGGAGGPQRLGQR